jgi:hypothetical protein
LEEFAVGKIRMANFARDLGLTSREMGLMSTQAKLAGLEEEKFKQTTASVVNVLKDIQTFGVRSPVLEQLTNQDRSIGPMLLKNKGQMREMIGVILDYHARGDASYKLHLEKQFGFTASWANAMRTYYKDMVLPVPTNEEDARKFTVRTVNMTTTFMNEVTKMQNFFLRTMNEMGDAYEEKGIGPMLRRMQQTFFPLAGRLGLGTITGLINSLKAHFAKSVQLMEEMNAAIKKLAEREAAGERGEGLSEEPGAPARRRFREHFGGGGGGDGSTTPEPTTPTTPEPTTPEPSAPGTGISRIREIALRRRQSRDRGGGGGGGGRDLADELGIGDIGGGGGGGGGGTPEPTPEGAPIIVPTPRARPISDTGGGGGRTGGRTTAVSPTGATTSARATPYHLGGSIDIEGRTYRYGSGGAGRGATPPGSYPINIGRGDIGPVGRRIGSIATVGGPGGVIKDPRYSVARAGIQIHPGTANRLDQLYSQGCFAVDRRQWPAFRAHLLDLHARTPGGLRIDVDPNGRAQVIARGQPVVTDGQPVGPGRPVSRGATPRTEAPTAPRAVIDRSLKQGSAPAPSGTLNAEVDFSNVPTATRATGDTPVFKTLRVTANRQGQKDTEGMLAPTSMQHTPWVP